MGKNADLDEVIAMFEDIEQALSRPQAFFDAHEQRYLDLARRVAVQTLILHKPKDLDADLWQENATEFAELIFTRPLNPGLEIGFAARTELDRIAASNRGTNPANFSPVTWQDVFDWVTAGAENGGKDLSAVEITRDRHPRQIAYDVHQAILQQRLGTAKRDYSGITQRLEDWINSRVLSGDMDELLILVLDAWVGALFPVISRDFEDWITYDVLGA